MEIVRQYPSVEGNFLYHDEEDGKRLFSDYIIRSSEADPWLECTPEEKDEEGTSPQKIKRKSKKLYNIDKI